MCVCGPRSTAIGNFLRSRSHVFSAIWSMARCRDLTSVFLELWNKSDCFKKLSASNLISCVHNSIKHWHSYGPQTLYWHWHVDTCNNLRKWKWLNVTTCVSIVLVSNTGHTFVLQCLVVLHIYTFVKLYICSKIED